MTVRQLSAILKELPPDMPVRVIVDGRYDLDPTWNVCGEEVWIEGVSKEKEAQA